MPTGTPTKLRRRRRRSSRQAAGSNGVAASLLSHITALVSQNESLTKQNRQLQASLDTISRAVQGIRPGSAQTATRGRRGRPAAAIQVVGRPRRRRRTLSPDSLAKRRAGLAKARAVLAAKRAAAKKG